MTHRNETRRIMLKDVAIGGGSPVTVQSMTCTDTADVSATLEQVRQLEEAGCDIVRVAVPDRDSALALPRIISGTKMPLVADIHFDHRLALLAMKNGAHGVRINPGTLGSTAHVAEIARQAAAQGVVVRVGVNSGSLERRLHDGTSRAEAGALAQSALEGVELLERHGVDRTSRYRSKPRTSRAP